METPEIITQQTAAVATTKRILIGAKEKAIEWNCLRKRVFCYDTSEADERFFKLKIAEWLQGTGYQGMRWYAFLMQIIWERNGGGKTVKYMYFNEFQQRLYVDKEFDKWALSIRDIQKKLLKIFHA